MQPAVQQQQVTQAVNQDTQAFENTDVTTTADYGQNSYYSMPQQRRENNAMEIGLLRELNPKKIMDDIEHYLLGEVYDFESYKYVKKFRQIMNKNGINTFLFIAGGVINQVVTLSNFDKEQISKMALFIMEKAIPVIDINWKEYGICDKSLLPTIHGMLFTLVYSSLQKALNEGERRMVGRTISENINVSRPIQGMYGDEQKKQGFLARFNPFAR
jgi:hypothetical protein